MSAKLENSAVATGLEKVSFHSSPKERQCQRMFKLLHDCTHFTCQQSKLKILQVRLQQYMNRELPDVQAGFRKGKGTKIKLPTSIGSLKKQESSRKASAAAAKSLQSCLTLCDPMDSSTPGSSVHRILQARILEWVAISFSLEKHLFLLY